MTAKGIGFITEAGQREELEFHWTALSGGSLEQLNEGQWVEFEKRPDHRDGTRTRAVNVRLLGKE